MKKQLKKEEKNIRKILNEWDFIPHSPDDEYDCLVHRILSVLYSRSTLDGIRLLIKKELEEHFGISENIETINIYSEKIWDWWVENHKFRTKKPSTFCCGRFREIYTEGNIIYAYDSGSKMDETEWFIDNLGHIYYCPFCGAFVKGYGWGDYDQKFPPNENTKIIKQK